MTMAAEPTRGDRSPHLHDLRLAVAVAVLVLVGFDVSLRNDFHFGLVDHETGSLLPGPTALIGVLVGTLPLTFRRWAPVPVFALVAGASLANQVLNHRPEPLPLAVLVALYSVVAWRPRVSGVAAAAYLAALVGTALVGWADVNDGQYYADVLAVVGTVGLGYVISLGRARAGRAEQRNAELAQAAEAQAREAVEEEQARIAREMHDILAHNLSVIVAQATAVRRVAADQPQLAADALGSIESVGRDALDGLRRMVGLLRIDQDRPGQSSQPGLDRLDALVEQVRRAGLPVELTIRGRRCPLPAAVELSALRVIQEALTNSLKHAGRTRAAVTLTYTENCLDVEVRDEPAPEQERPLPAAQEQGSGGYGLISMQQRVSVLGGELTAGPDGSRGFRVRARLPVAGGRDLSGTVVTG